MDLLPLGLYSFRIYNILIINNFLLLAFTILWLLDFYYTYYLVHFSLRIIYFFFILGFYFFSFRSLIFLYLLRLLFPLIIRLVLFILSFHQEVASDSFCFLINSFWLLTFMLYVFSLFFSGFNLYWWKGIHFS